jgi:hypothetical protein
MVDQSRRRECGGSLGDLGRRHQGDHPDDRHRRRRPAGVAEPPRPTPAARTQRSQGLAGVPAVRSAGWCRSRPGRWC